MTDKFGIGSMGMGSLSGMLDTMELVKRAWSSFNLPSNLAPTLDVEELDRRITDLKAVEQWLTMNLSMLQGTIKTLEVQRGTLAALQAFGQTMSAPADSGAFAAQAMAAMQRAATGSPAAASGAESTARSGPAADAKSPSPGPSTAANRSQAADSGGAHGAPGTAQAPGARPPSAADGGAAPASSIAEEVSRAAAAVNPGAWWNLLQSQFEQIAQAALSGSGLATGSPGTGDRAAAPAGQAPGRTDARRPAGPTKRAGKSRQAGAAPGRKPRAA